MDGPKAIASPARKKGKTNKLVKNGAPVETIVHIKKMDIAKKTNPNGMEVKPGSINAFLTGLPFQRTSSFAFNNLFNPDKDFTSYVNTLWLLHSLYFACREESKQSFVLLTI